jgi:PAS domain S-box-containing protein
MPSKRPANQWPSPEPLRIRRSMSRSYLYSLIVMAVLPVFVLASLWIADLQREFEQRSEAWRRTYVETQKKTLMRQVGDVLDNLAFESASIETAQRLQLKLEVDNSIAQLDSLLREKGVVRSREQLLARARDLLAPLRFGGGSDHFFIHTLAGTAVLMPAYPQWQGQDISDRRDANGVDFVARLKALARAGGEGYLEVWYAALPGRVGPDSSRPAPLATIGNAYLTTQYIRYYAPLDIYVGAVGYMDDMLVAVQREELARLASAAADESILTVIDHHGSILLDRRRLAGSIDSPAPVDAAYWQQLRSADPPGGFLRSERTRANSDKPAPVLVVVRDYPGWKWRVAATFFLDNLELDIAGQRAALQQRIERRIAQIGITVLALIAVAALIALRLAQRTREAMRRFESFFTAASASSSTIDIARLPFIEFEQLAVDANRMIEQRTRIETELRQSEQRFEMALNASGSHLWDMNLVDYSIVMNGSLNRQLGYPETSALFDAGQWQDLVHPDDLNAVMASMGQLLVPAGQYGIEFRARHSDGTYRWMLARGAAVEFDAIGNPTRALGTIIEITDRKRMEQELVAARIAAEDANHAKSQFLSSISHELRTPLNGVLGYAQILLRDQSISAEHRHNLRAIESCGQHLLTLINDVLDLAKIESGRIDIDEQPCDLYELLDNVGNIVRERVESKGLAYRLEIARAVPAVIRTDAVKLRQILVNLLGNAVKFTARGSVTLRVAVGRHGSELLFAVEDTGVGIAEEKQREIFFPFHQVGQVAGGTGLGLPISQRLCEAMGGQLRVRSAMGAGSCFSFNLPMKISARALMPAAPHAENRFIDTAGQALTVMVADDNQINRQVLAGMLRASGIAIVEAENGQEALDQLHACARKGRPLPLVLMDVRMPVMDGFTATRAIKADPILRDTVVIAVSASVFPDVVTRMREEGCDDFVSKPVRIGVLLEVVAKYLRLPLRAVAEPQVAARAARLPSTLLQNLRAALAVGDIETLRAALPTLRTTPELDTWVREFEQRLDHFDIEAVRELLTEAAAH